VIYFHIQFFGLYRNICVTCSSALVVVVHDDGRGAHVVPVTARKPETTVSPIVSAVRPLPEPLPDGHILHDTLHVHGLTLDHLGLDQGGGGLLGDHREHLGPPGGAAAAAVGPAAVEQTAQREDGEHAQDGPYDGPDGRRRVRSG